MADERIKYFRQIQGDIARLQKWIESGGYGCKSVAPCDCWQHTAERLLAEIARLKEVLAMEQGENTGFGG